MGAALRIASFLGTWLPATVDHHSCGIRVRWSHIKPLYRPRPSSYLSRKPIERIQPVTQNTLNFGSPLLLPSQVSKMKFQAVSWVVNSMKIRHLQKDGVANVTWLQTYHLICGSWPNGRPYHRHILFLNVLSLMETIATGSPTLLVNKVHVLQRWFFNMVLRHAFTRGVVAKKEPNMASALAHTCGVTMYLCALAF